MSQDLQARTAEEALDEVKATLTDLRNENEKLKNKNKELEAKLRNHEHERPGVKRLLEAEERNRGYLRRLAARYGADQLTGYEFSDPRSIAGGILLKKLQEERWFEWFEKELQFAKEMREAYSRVNGKEGTAAKEIGSVGKKRRRADGD